MDRLEFKPGVIKPGGRMKLIVERYNGATLKGRAEQFFDSDHQFAPAARMLDIPAKQLALYVAQHRQDGVSTIDLGKLEIAPVLVTYRLRGRKEPASKATIHDTFEAALAAPCEADDPVIEWEDDNATCALDLDFHDVDAPCATDLLAEAVLLEPRPGMWWVSRSGGLRAIFQQHGHSPARELAAVAGLQLITRFPTASLELNRRTRRPNSDVTKQTPTGESSFVRRLYSVGTTNEDTAAWLLERDFEVGQRYSHDRCPVNPSPRAQANADPVAIHDDHVFCYICQADGIRRGSKSPGYFPYAKLCGDVVPTQFRKCVERLTHWGHAQYVVRQLVQNEVLAKSIYAACLRQVHGDDPRVACAFSAGEPVGLVRMDGHWATYAGQPVKVDRVSPVLMALPSAKYIDQDGEVKVSAEVVEWLSQGCDLSPMGYPAVIPVWGIHMTRDQELPAHKIFVTMQVAELRHDANADRRPKYLLSANRLAEGEAWDIIERAYPRVNREAIRLLVAAKGCSEFHSGLPPMVFFTGPTGSGKTASVKLAAGICGDRATTVQFSPQTERVRASLLMAKQQGSFAAFDEYVKSARAARQTADQAMEILLGFTPDSVSHMLYIGPVPLGDLPVCYWADTSIPPEVLSHSQIGRRVHHVEQVEELAWEPALKAAGINDPENIRLGPMEYVHAANTILSGVIDRWFPPGPPTDFAEVATSLGFKKLRESDTANEKVDLIRRLFRCVCAGPGLDGELRKRWPHPAWRLVDLSRGEGELVETWRWLADSDNQLKSRSIAECDLKKLLGLRLPATLDARSHGMKLVIRFANTQEQVYNADLLLSPDVSSIHGHRDAVVSGPAEDWQSSLPAGFHDASAECSLPDAT